MTRTLTDTSLSMMIADLCAQHTKLTGTRKERNAARLKELCTEVVRRGAACTFEAWAA